MPTHHHVPTHHHAQRIRPTPGCAVLQWPTQPQPSVQQQRQGVLQLVEHMYACCVSNLGIFTHTGARVDIGSAQAAQAQKEEKDPCRFY